MISLSGFSGESPRTDPALLADNQASDAVDCDFSTGGVTGLTNSETVTSYTALAAIKGTYVHTSPDGSEVAYEWPYDVDVVRGPVAEDDHRRFYWTENNAGTKAFRYASVNENLTGGRVTTSYKVGVLASTGWDKSWSDIGFSHDVVRKPPGVGLSELTNKTFKYYVTDPGGASFLDVTSYAVSGVGVGTEYNGWHSEYTVTLSQSVASIGQLTDAATTYTQRQARVAINGEEFTATLFGVGATLRYVSLTSPIAAAFPSGVTIGTQVQVWERTATMQGVGDGNERMVDVETVLGTFYARTPTSYAYTNADMPTALATPDKRWPTDARLTAIFTVTLNGEELSVKVIQDSPDAAILPVGDGIAFRLTQLTSTTYKLSLTFAAYPVSELRAYLFTFVNKFGEESEPSLPVEATYAPQSHAFRMVIDVAAVVAKSLENGMVLDRAPLRALRIYRSAVGANAPANYYYVGAIKIGDEAIELPGETYLTLDSDSNASTWYWTDTVATAALGESLATLDFISDTAELQGLQGLAGLHNGMLAAFKGNEVWVCEPYAPWAYKRANVMTLPHQVVALQQHEQGAVALTELTPYYLSGATPESMLPTALSGDYPCIGKNAVTSVGGMALYLTTDGPVYVQGISAKLDQSTFDRAAIRAFIAAVGSDLRLLAVGNYVLMFSAVPAGGATYGGYLFDFDTKAWTKMSEKFAFAARVPANTFGTEDYIVFAPPSGTQWNVFGKLTTRRAWSWESKVFTLARPTNYGAAQIFGTGTITLKVYADDVLKATIPITLSQVGAITRLPAGFMATRWKFRIEGAAESRLIKLLVANSMAELAGA